MSISPEAVQRDRAQAGLWTRTAAVAGRLNRAHGDLVDIAVELIEGGHWGDGGFRSAEHYFVVRAGLSPARAHDVVTLARRRAELPVVAGAVATGELSLDQAAVVAHHVPVSHQRSVGELALHMTVPQLRRAVSRHAFAVAPAVGDTQTSDQPAQGPDPQSEQARRACARPELSMSYDRDGRFELRYSAPATVGALVEQAIREAKDALFAQGGTDQAVDGPEGRTSTTAAASRPGYADAMEEIARRALDGVTSTSRASHYRVYVHLSEDGAWVNGRSAIPAALVQRLLASSSVQPVWERDGHPVAVGRSMRILPERARRLVEDRDRGCRFPGCTATRFVEVHHLTRWADGGSTDPDNQASLCPFHHDAIDRGDFTISGDPDQLDGLTVVNRYGVRVGPPSKADTAPLPDGDRSPRVDEMVYSPPTGERARWADIEIPPDHDLPARVSLRVVRRT